MNFGKAITCSLQPRTKLSSKIITSSVLFDDDLIEIFKEKYLSLQNDNSRNLILSKELDANIQGPFPRGEPVAIKSGGVDGLLDNGKLTLKTGDSDTTFYFKQNVNFEYDRKLDENLQNIIDTKKLPAEDMLSDETCINFDSGTVVFKTQDGEKIMVRHRCLIILFKDGQKIFLDGN
ncbi:hypothetical protein HCN44_008017 [Aphidius gifuensis]|uniref:Uncharacterized protein n=1 Tax=Aphidius gifuensis TaxID=684658 RepID=A0A835CPN3_APHGI|nr:hypothetical protein HCN44_008017 [Aphidius gifuensis]